MRILAIETAAEACSVALFEDGAMLEHDHRVLGRGHAEQLIPMIAQLPNKGRADRILVSLGPGSFTGVRVGLAAARALGIAWGAKVLGYPTLRLIQIMAARQASGFITVCMNGGHGEWFVQSFADTGEAQGKPRSLTPAEVRLAGVHSVIAGNRACECGALFEEQRNEIDMLPDARFAHLLADTHLTNALRPIYGRAPDATPQNPVPAS
ncbi:MAG: tRNA (adenosine(37)-N6)-threonylcarbamoyltransferase complex dimerization subunit type 1 TsaB [Pseudomonadota bacterium]